MQKIHPPARLLSKAKALQPFGHDLLPDVYNEDACGRLRFLPEFLESLRVLI